MIALSAVQYEHTYPTISVLMCVHEDDAMTLEVA